MPNELTCFQTQATPGYLETEAKSSERAASSHDLETMSYQQPYLNLNRLYAKTTLKGAEIKAIGFSPCLLCLSGARAEGTAESFV